MNNYRPIYPEVDVIDNESEFTLFSILRKEKDGVWYEWVCKTKYNHPADLSVQKKIEIVNKFHATVYGSAVVHEITLDDPTEFFDKCETQESEKERLKNLPEWVWNY